MRLDPEHREALLAVWTARARWGPGCWTWSAGRDPKGYGQLMATVVEDDGSTRRRQHKAHRVSWMLHHGPILDKLHVLHKCDNPPCVRPDHLFLGTNGDNVRDCYQKGRRISSGSHNSNAKLTAAQVEAIRADPRPSAAVAADYGVHPGHVRKLRTRHRWA